MMDPTIKLSLDLSAVETEYPEVFAYIEELRAALKPFADYAKRMTGANDVPDRCSLLPCLSWYEASGPTVGDLRKALAVLSPAPTRDAGGVT